MTAVTIVVPTIAGRHTLLQRALDSIAAQSFRDFEVWVMPDGPVDLTDVVGTYRETPLGRRWQKWGAVQKLVAGYLCESPYMAYLHDDDYWKPRHLELLMAAMMDPIKLDNGNSVFPDFAYSMIDWCGTVIGTDPPRHAQIDTGCILHRTDLLRVSTWDPQGDYALDWELVERWMAGGARWRFVPEVTLVYPEKRE